MKITVIRHGETNENVAGIVQGQKYGTLSPNGLLQIKQAAETLAADRFAICYTSDLPRCLQTTDAIIRQHPGLEVHQDARLRERDMKPLEGRKFTDLVDWDWTNDTDINHKTPEGETWADVAMRVADALNDMYNLHAGKEVLIVTHGGPMRTMLMLFTGQPWQQVGPTKVGNCEVRRWEMLAPVNTTSVR